MRYKSTKSMGSFTLVELIITVGVIAIIASIAIVSYGTWKSRISVTQLKNDLSNAASAMETARTFGDTYPSSIPTNFSASNGVTLSGGAQNSGKNFCITATQGLTSYRLTDISSTSRPGACSGSQKDMLSLIKWDSWTLGTGSVTGYTTNGDGNSRVNDTNPWGATDIVWDVSNQDVASDADGGWNGGTFSIDNTKMYRFSTFVRRKTVGNGSFYLGTHGYPDAVLNRSNGAANTNPYFSARGWWGSVDLWYLVVGYIWPSGSGIGASMTDSGIYSMDGLKIISNGDFVWQPTTTSSHHRSYMYYSTDITTNQQWYQPRVDAVDGTEPTINELLNNVF